MGSRIGQNSEKQIREKHKTRVISNHVSHEPSQNLNSMRGRKMSVSHSNLLKQETQTTFLDRRTELDSDESIDSSVEDDWHEVKKDHPTERRLSM